VLYKAFKAKHGDRDFYDIGNSQESPPSPSVGNGLFLATPGWDYVSGMGTPDVNNLILDITGVAKPAPPARPVLPKQAAGASSTPRANDCTPLFTDQKGDDSYPAGLMTGNNPQLDILAGNIDYVTEDANGNSGKFLKTVLVINDLSTSLAGPAATNNEYYFTWTYKGTEYFSHVEVGADGTPTYHDGVVEKTANGSTNDDKNSDTGEFNTGKGGKPDSGKTGTVVVYVPLKNVGLGSADVNSGTKLTKPAVATYGGIEVPMVGGSLQPADTASGHYDYIVGESCAKTAGIAPGPYSTKGNAPPYKIVVGNHKKHEPSAGPTPEIVESAPPKVFDGCHPHHGGNGPPGGNGEGTPPGGNGGGTSPGGNGAGTPPGAGGGNGGGSGNGGNGPHGPSNEASVAHGNLAHTGLEGAVPIGAAVLLAIGLGGSAYWRRRPGG
jgi:hypothetical protein